MTPDTILHALAGATGILSGAIALITRKGGSLHRMAGTVFFVAMMTAAATAMWLAYRIGNMGFLVGGVLILYLLATAWMTARRRSGETGLFEIGACVVTAGGSVAVFLFTLQSVQDGTALLGGIPGFIFSGVAAIASGLDLSVVLRGGLSGKQRIARHLWRAHIGLFAAVGSFFPGQLQFFPEFIQQVRPIILLFIPSFLIIGLMSFWLARLFFTGWYRRRAGIASTPELEPAKASA